MYVGWQQYQESAFASPEVTEGDWPKIASVADGMIDAITLWRAGEAVRNGRELPEEVVRLYCAIASIVPGAMAEATSAGREVTAFSNGVDSFTFANPEALGAAISRRLGWLVEALPVEWVSSVAGEVGRCE